MIQQKLASKVTWNQIRNGMPTYFKNCKEMNKKMGVFATLKNNYEKSLEKIVKGVVILNSFETLGNEDEFGIAALVPVTSKEIVEKQKQVREMAVKLFNEDKEKVDGIFEFANALRKFNIKTVLSIGFITALATTGSVLLFGPQALLFGIIIAAALILPATVFSMYLESKKDFIKVIWDQIQFINRAIAAWGNLNEKEKS